MRIGIGHNEGPPLDPARSWRVYCWRRAKAQMLPPAPVEVVRRRVRRAAELGLSYPRYASIVTITGRDIGAYLVTSAALDAEGAVRPGAERLFAGLTRCELLVLRTLHGPDLEAIAAALGRLVAAAGRVGAIAPRAPLPGGRDAIGALIGERRLPSGAVAMIGAGSLERAWADAARLAAFLPAEEWFGAA